MSSNFIIVFTFNGVTGASSYIQLIEYGSKIIQLCSDYAIE